MCQIRTKSDKIFYFLFGTLEPGLNRGEKVCHTAQKLCSRFFLNSEDPKLQCYHSFGGVLANLKFDFFFALKVKLFLEFYIWCASSRLNRILLQGFIFFLYFS